VTVISRSRRPSAPGTGAATSLLCDRSDHRQISGKPREDNDPVEQIVQARHDGLLVTDGASQNESACSALAIFDLLGGLRRAACVRPEAGAVMTPGMGAGARIWIFRRVVEYRILRSPEA
jgi:hypothetical protein